MSKTKPGGLGTDRKVDVVREGDGSRLLSQPVTALSRPTLAVGAPGHTYIVQSQHSQHDVKNFAKLSTRPIAPAPPNQAVPAIVGRTVPSSTPNIPSIISSCTTTLTVPKTSAILRGPSANLQIPNPGLSATVNLPLARQPVLQAVKSGTQNSARSPSPAIPQAQPQDLSSRTNFPLHGSIAPVSSSGPHPMQHITLNRMTTPIAPGDNPLQQRAIPSQIPTTDSLQQRISVSLADGPGLHQRISADLRNAVNLQAPVPGKLSQPPRVITTQPLAQQMAMKSVNLAVSNPVMLNSINPSLATATTTTMASSTPIPVASSSNLMSGQSISASSIQSSSLSTPLLTSTDSMTRPPGSIISMTSLPSSVQQANPTPSHPENRSSNPNALQIGAAHNDPMWFQHFVFSQQQGSQAPLVSQSAANVVRPGASTFAFLSGPSQNQKLQAPTSNLAASQLAAHAMSVSSNVRYNNMMVMDPLRPPHPLHSPFSSTSNSVADKLVNLASRATVASSIYTASVGVQSHMAGGLSQGLSATPVSNPSSSPRPSILRKRTSEATGVVIRKPNFNLNQDGRCHSPPRLESAVSNHVNSPKIAVKNNSPMSENSQSSTDTALSSNDATTPTQNHHNDKAKVEQEESTENGPTFSAPLTNNVSASPAVSQAASLSEASPRKRARKQLLHANEELMKEAVSTNLFRAASEERKENNVSSSDDEMLSQEDAEKESLKEIRGEYTDEEGVRWVLEKPKPNFILIGPDCINSKSKHNHFVRHSDVKPKDERRPTVNELSNQRGIPQKVNGWKLYFSASQLEELMEVEKDMEAQFAEVQSALSKVSNHKHASDEISKIHEMSQANIQRCQLIQNQLTEARSSMIKTLDHKPRIQEIVNKHMSKRPIKKKERT